MSSINSCISTCRHCQHYAAEGRRGGQCHQLGVPVQSNWKACSLAIHPFVPVWQELVEVASWHVEALEETDVSPQALSPQYVLDVLVAEPNGK